MTVAELTARISVVGEAAARQALARVGSSARSMGEAIRTAADSMRLLDMAGMAMAKASGLQVALSYDSQIRGLAAYSANAEQLTAQMGRLQEIAKLPGVGLAEVRQGVLNLEAAGMAAQMAERSIKAFGNAIALAGRGKEDLAGAVLQLSQMVANGKLAGDELTIISERVPQIRKVMKEAFGTSSTEEISKMGLTMDQIIERMIKGLEKLPKASGGAITTMDNLSDALDQALLPIGRGIIDIFNSIAGPGQTLIEILQQSTQRIGEMLSAIGQSGVLTQVLDMLISGIGNIGDSWQTGLSNVAGYVLAFVAYVPQLWSAMMTDIGNIWNIGLQNIGIGWQNFLGMVDNLVQEFRADIVNAFVETANDAIRLLNTLEGLRDKVIKTVLGDNKVSQYFQDQGQQIPLLKRQIPVLNPMMEFQTSGFQQTAAVAGRMTEFGAKLGRDIAANIKPQGLPEGLIFGGQKPGETPGNQPTPAENTLNRIERNTRQTADEITKRQIGGGQIAQLGVTAAEMRASRGMMAGSGYQSSAVMGGSIIERQIRALTMDQIRRSGTYGIPRG